MHERPYQPERLPPAAERTIDQKSLRAALTVARRIHETDQAAQQAEPTTKDERWELNARLRIAEMEALLAWSETNGLLWDAAEFTRRWLSYGEIEGGEHQVYQAEGLFYKRNNMAYHSSYLEYFHRVVLHNYLFAETALRFEGFVWYDNLLQPVISQKALLGRRGATRDEVEYEMKLRGFTRHVADNYHNPAVGILVEDLHDENVLVDTDGDLLIFDPVIYLVKPEMNLPAHQHPLS